MRFLALSGLNGSTPAAALASRLRGGGDEVLEHALEVSAESRSGRIAAALIAAEELLTAQRPDALLLCGEGGEVAGAALAAVKLGIPQARVGAGMRTGERTDADEIDRAIADRASDILLCADHEALRRLAREGLAEQTRVVGDVTDDPGAAVDEIRAWLGTYTSGP
jgi:UDP-N-acetylglucosamine 2-epimerase